MLYYAFVFYLITVMAAAFGAAAGISKIVFLVSLALCVVTGLSGLLRRR